MSYLFSVQYAAEKHRGGTMIFIICDISVHLGLLEYKNKAIDAVEK